jgi:GT2 family glycosyltransferase
MTQKKPDLSVIILNFNTRELTLACLSTVYHSETGPYTIEVIVCDNASEDGSEVAIRKKYPKVHFIQNGKNIGFAAGNNPGIKKSSGRYVLLLNSDTEVSESAFREMIAFMDSHPDAGASTCRLLLPDGSMDPASHRGIPTPWVAFTYMTKLERLFPKTKLFGEYHQGYKDMTQAHTVDCISGAFFMVRRNVIENVGLLDEDFFMYAEDIDWAYRIRRAGWEIWFNPYVSVLHKKKQSGRANFLRSRRVRTEIYFHRYNWMFYTKHFAPTYNPVVTLAVNALYSVRLWLLETVSL